MARKFCNNPFNRYTLVSSDFRKFFSLFSDGSRRDRAYMAPIAPVLTLLAVVLLEAPAFACSDPKLHPGWQEYQDRIKELGEQPDIGVQLFYRIKKEASGSARRVTLAFRPGNGVNDATFSVLPGAKLKLEEPVENAPIEKGTVELIVNPMHPGVHLIQIDMAALVDGEPAKKTLLIPVEVDLHGPAHPAFATRALPTVPAIGLHGADSPTVE